MRTPSHDFNEGVQAASGVIERWAADYQQMADRAGVRASDFTPIERIQYAELRAKAHVLKSMIPHILLIQDRNE